MNMALYAMKLGEIPTTVELPWAYFQIRGCFLDCRGPLVIAASSQWGLGIIVLTRSHDIEAWPELGKSKDYGVEVGPGAWIGSRALLTGCTIGEQSIVAAGTVVRGQTVKPRTMVAGNPARIVARWNGQTWEYLPESETGYRRELDGWIPF